MKDLKEYIKSKDKTIYDILYLYWNNEDYSSSDRRVQKDLDRICNDLKLPCQFDLYYEDTTMMFDIYNPGNGAARIASFSCVVGSNNELQVELEEMPSYSNRDYIDKIMTDLGFKKEKEFYVLSKQ